MLKNKKLMRLSEDEFVILDMTNSGSKRKIGRCYHSLFLPLIDINVRTSINLHDNKLVKDKEGNLCTIFEENPIKTTSLIAKTKNSKSKLNIAIKNKSKEDSYDVVFPTEDSEIKISPIYENRVSYCKFYDDQLFFNIFLSKDNINSLTDALTANPNLYICLNLSVYGFESDIIEASAVCVLEEILLSSESNMKSSNNSHETTEIQTKPPNNVFEDELKSWLFQINSNLMQLIKTVGIFFIILLIFFASGAK